MSYSNAVWPSNASDPWESSTKASSSIVGTASTSWLLPLHAVQILTYMKLSAVAVGALVNF